MNEAVALLEETTRRYFLYCLFIHPTPMSLPDVADQLTVWSGDESGDSYLRQRLYLYNELYHDHLPSLREADIVEYDQRADMVWLGLEADAVRPVVGRYLLQDYTELVQAEKQSSDRDG